MIEQFSCQFKKIDINGINPVKELLNAHDLILKIMKEDGSHQMSLNKSLESINKIFHFLENQAIDAYNQKISEAQQISTNYFTTHMPDIEKIMDKANGLEHYKI
jgi:hypothetical protein